MEDIDICTQIACINIYGYIDVFKRIHLLQLYSPTNEAFIIKMLGMTKIFRSVSNHMFFLWIE